MVTTTTKPPAAGRTDRVGRRSSGRNATAPAETSAPAESGSAPSGGGEGITLAVNPWTGSAVNANVAKVVLESMGTPVELLDIDEFATWPGMEDGSIDAVLEVWPSGHAADYETYITTNQTVVDIGLLGPEAKIGWYVPTFVVDEHPELATWEGFKDPELAGLFATAESGDLGQFLMGDPTYVTFDEQIIANLGLPLQYVVGGSEAAVLTALDNAVADQTPVLVQFWKPHWKHARARPHRGQAARGDRRVPGIGGRRRRWLRLRLRRRRAVQGGVGRARDQEPGGVRDCCRSCSSPPSSRTRSPT